MSRKPHDIERYKRILRECSNIREAAHRLSLTYDSLAQVFQRNGLRVGDFLKKPGLAKTLPPGPPDDPVASARERRDARDVKAEVDRLTEMLAVEREKVALYSALQRPRKPLVIPRREKTSGLREMTALVAASDWHPEEEVDPVKVQGRNKFNLTIADLRINRFFHGIVDLVQHHRASKKVVIRDVVLALIGDLITGHIHEELLMTAQLAPVETILWLTPRIAAGIRYLLAELDLVSLVIPCDIGNHGRTTKKRNITTGCETSFEWGMYVSLEREFASDSRVRFDTSPANDHYVDIYGFRLHTTHGDSVKYQGGVGGLTIPLMKAVTSWDTDVSSTWHLIGHWHQFLDVDKAIVNGSLIGWAPYGKWIKARYNARDLSQHFSLVDPSRGRCHSTPIWVSSMKEELPFWSPAERALWNRRQEDDGERGAA